MFYVVNTNRDYCKHIVNKLAFLTILRAIQGKKKGACHKDKLLLNRWRSDSSLSLRMTA